MRMREIQVRSYVKRAYKKSRLSDHLVTNYVFYGTIKHSQGNEHTLKLFIKDVN